MCLALGLSGLKDGSATLCCKIGPLPFLGLRPHAPHPGTIQGKEWIQFCHLATLRREGRLSALSLTVLQSSLSLVCVSSRPFPALCGWMYMCARLAKGYQAILGQTFPRNELGNAVFFCLINEALLTPTSFSIGQRLGTTACSDEVEFCIFLSPLSCIYEYFASLSLAVIL